MDVPLARTPDVPDDHLKRVKVQRRDCVEGNIEED